jgi:hypothetical protein
MSLEKYSCCLVGSGSFGGWKASLRTGDRDEEARCTLDQIE